MSRPLVFDETDQRQFELAIQQRDGGDLEAARQSLEALAQRCTNAPALLFVLGEVYWELGDLQQALIQYRHAVQLAPTSELASLGLFHCLWESEREAEAIAEAQRFLRLSDSEDYRAILADLGQPLPSSTN